MPPTKPHKFCWFNGDPAEYGAAIANSRVTGAEAFGIYAELQFDNDRRLCVNDGTNIRLTDAPPRNYQLLIQMDDGRALAFTVAMYGGIILHDGAFDNEYYHKSRQAISPFSKDFRAVFDSVLARGKPALSAKALIATEQRFPGVGNGVAQDVLFAAGLHPKRKLGTFSGRERERLFDAMVTVLEEMTRLGGRDTEKDLFGNPGGYRTKMSRNGLEGGCPGCGGAVIKEAYLGGSVYYCPHCQALEG